MKFTNKKHSQRGIYSVILGLIALFSFLMVIQLSYKQGGGMSPKLGAATVLALVIACVGEVIGVLSRQEEDVYYVFPDLGIFFNGLVIAGNIALLYIGVYGYV